MISKTLSTSVRYARLFDVAPAIAEFAQSLYPLLVAHADDHGRQQGDPFTVKHLIHPTSPRALPDFVAALQALNDVELIAWYEAGHRRCIEIANFDAHQAGLHRRTDSSFPGPDGSGAAPARPISALDASEEQIEQRLYRLILAGRVKFSGMTVTHLERQVRKGSSYIDLLATTAEGPLLVIEVKRTRVTTSAIQQVKNYCELFDADTIPVVIGHGLADGLGEHDGTVLLAVYDDKVRPRAISSYHVKTREMTLSFLPSEQNRTEQKGSEQERLRHAAPASPTVLQFPTVGKQQDWPLTEANVTEWTELFPGLPILSEARQALAWIKANPSKRKTAGGMPRFLVSWFGRSANNGHGQKSSAAHQRALGPVYRGSDCPHTPRCNSRDWCAAQQARDAGQKAAGE